MKKYIIILLTLLSVAACQEDDSVVNNNSVSFTEQNDTLVGDAATVDIVFMNPTAAAGTLTVSVTPTNVEYGTDFSTSPEAVEDEITIPFEANTTSLQLNITGLTAAFEGQQKSILLQISSSSLGGIAIPAATSSVQIVFVESPVAINTINVNSGGATVPNQVYVDLSSGMQTSVLRTRWDLGFFSGSEFRVALNGSINMAVKQLATTDMTENIAIDETVAVGEDTGSGISNGNIMYTDDPSGDINQTAIVVAETEADNKVYLVNLGYNISTESPIDGEVDAYGTPRGWMKIRVLRDGEGYKLQYAEPDALTFTEVLIPKSEGFNFTFFSFDTDAIVSVQPQTDQWDLNFTSFTDHVNSGGMYSLGVQDFVVTNVRGGTQVYEVLISAGIAYEDFELANVDASLFDTAAANDQRVIGSNWRNEGTPPTVKEDRFYVLRDAAGNIYKLRFLSLMNDAGIRGFTSFEYSLLQE